ncbi:MAG: hypothetical protein ABJF10_05670 [Chthoniobacter sp.]|uniref:capsular polysaccharide export protein, LipB/KpsS family n=1 Tax=Chthoniobacter sp. TaxID=2510640 RepID=UPI0032ADAC40
MRVPVSYVWSNPYYNSAAEKYRMHLQDLRGSCIFSEVDMRKYLSRMKERPDIMLLWGFCTERTGMVGLCREYGIDVATWEDGFFPHYDTIHFDPLGFCWESSLPRMMFRGCSGLQRERARQSREAWLAKPVKALPAAVRPPYVLWPLQLVGDKVNEWDLGLTDWTGLIRHFRSCLPARFQLVLKDHPLFSARDVAGLDELLRELPNTVRVPRESHLPTLLRECQAVAGANSSVLYEARLMHHKPTYAYARSWFTNHDDLFVPVNPDFCRSLPRQDWIENPAAMRTERLNDYTDWFLAQLLARQLDGKIAAQDSLRFRTHLGRLSYHSYLEQGDAAFDA